MVLPRSTPRVCIPRRLSNLIHDKYDMRKYIDIVCEEVASLDMSDKARMARAKELGFTIPAYHGTGAKFDQFDVEKGKPSVIGGYAPHFADAKGEADGYRKKAGRGAKVLHCLLRINKPLIVSLEGAGQITPAEYQRLTGEEWPKDSEWKPTGYKALNRIMDRFGWTDHRANWTNAYKILSSKGYDALYYPDILADYTSGRYGKYVVFDPRNIRLVDAAFDPARSSSADLRA